MIIAIDLGNTACTIGIYDGDKLHHRFFTTSDLNRTSVEYRLIFESFIETTNYRFQDCEAIVFSSVVPPLTPIIKEAMLDLCDVPFLSVGKKIKTGLALHVDNPSEVGSDLVAAGVGGVAKYGFPLVIVDMGTATKIIAIDASGAFVGVTIAPGLMVSFNALIGRASQLADVELAIPPYVIGRNTIDALSSGLLHGHASLVKGLTDAVARELKVDKQVVLTGGYAQVLRPLLPNFIYDENLLLDGLYRIYNKNKEGKRNK